MLERVHVKSFESLYNVDLSLGKFTVVLGESSNGKSAFIRSLHALAHNIRGNGHVTYGHKFATVQATMTDWIVTMERGEGRNVYRVTDRRSGIDLPTFEKVNKAVPEKVTEILSMSEANFAGQDDPPFLLKDSGAQVARVLGELTNVSTIFEAVQKGNARRKSMGTELKTRQSDLAEAKRDLETFQDLPEQIAAVALMETLLWDAERVNERLYKLKDLIDEYAMAEFTLSSVPTYPSVPTLESVESDLTDRNILAGLIENLESAEDTTVRVRMYPDVPALDEIVDLHERAQLLRNLTEDLTQAMVDLEVAKDLQNQMDTLEVHYESEIHNLLIEAGTCPTCNQKVS